MKRILSLYTNSYANLQRNIWVIALAQLINRSGSMVLLFTSLYMTKELHFTIGQAGIVMSFYGIGSVLGSYAGGWLTDRKKFKDIMIFSLVISSMVLLLMLFATSLIALSAIIFCYAFTADMFRPAGSASIAAYSDSANRTRSVSLLRMAINLGFTVGPAIGGVIALHLGYKLLFVIDACSGFAAALMLFIYLPKEKTENNKHQSAVLNDSGTSAYRDTRYLFFIFLVALYGMCFFQLFASIPQYFNRVCNYNEDTIGLLMALNGLLVVIIEMPLIASLEKKQKIFRFIIAGVLCLPVSFALLLFGKAMMIWAIAYTFIITLSEIFAMPFMMNYSLNRPPKERQGQYGALYSIAYGISNIAAPLIGLGIADRYGFDNMFYFLIALSLVTAGGFILIGRLQK